MQRKCVFIWEYALYIDKEKCGKMVVVNSGLLFDCVNFSLPDYIYIYFFNYNKKMLYDVFQYEFKLIEAL